MIAPLLNPNGIGIAPDGGGPIAGRVQAGFAGRTYLDSLGIQKDGAFVVATLFEHAGLATISPVGGIIHMTPIPEIIVTNVDFGGPQGEIAYVTIGSSGEIYSLDWPGGGFG